jgi:hypothetical protein
MIFPNLIPLPPIPEVIVDTENGDRFINRRLIQSLPSRFIRSLPDGWEGRTDYWDPFPDVSPHRMIYAKPYSREGITPAIYHALQYAKRIKLDFSASLSFEGESGSRTISEEIDIGALAISGLGTNMQDRSLGKNVGWDIVRFKIEDDFQTSVQFQDMSRERNFAHIGSSRIIGLSPFFLQGIRFSCRLGLVGGDTTARIADYRDDGQRSDLLWIGQNGVGEWVPAILDGPAEMELKIDVLELVPDILDDI